MESIIKYNEEFHNLQSSPRGITVHSLTEMQAEFQHRNITDVIYLEGYEGMRG
jgi:hypothetical protein